MNTNDTITTRAMTRSTLIALITCALPISVWSGDADVSRVEINKIHDLVQTSTADPVDETAPYAFGMEVNDSSSSFTLITSAAYTPPGGSSTSLSGDGEGNFEFEQSFATQAGMDATFPNGTHNFTLQTTTAPATYSPALTLSGDSYPITPKLSNTNWSGGKLQFDSSADYTFTWNSSGSGASFSITDATEDNKFFTNSTTTSTTVPAGTLSPNQDYLAVVCFSTANIVQDGPTTLNGFYGTFTHFVIHTVPEPSAQLSISRVGTASVQITWATNFADHVLEYATNLPAAGWSTVTNVIVVAGDRLSVTTEASAAQRFFRLRKF